MFNQFAINPAYAGVRKALDITLIYRSQWVNVDKAPVSQTFSATTSIPKQTMGIGLLLINQTQGIQRETSGNIAYSYSIPISELSYKGRGRSRNSGYFDGLKLSLGLQLGALQFAKNVQELRVVQDGTSDPILNQENINSILFDLGIGAFLYSERFYIGVSVPNFIKSDLGVNNAPNSVRERHYFLTSGIVFSVREWLDIKPKLLVRVVEGAGFQYDTNINFFFLKRFWVGFSYRHQESFVSILDLNVNQNMKIGYSFDFGLNDFTSAAGGSHEIIFNYYLRYKRQLLISPRYF